MTEYTGPERREGVGRRQEDRDITLARAKFSKDLKKIRWLAIAQLVTGLLALAALVTVLVTTQKVQKNQTEIHALAKNNHVLAVEALTLSRAIQQQRKQTILSNCRDTNHKHRTTVRTLDRELKQIRRRETPVQRTQTKQSRAATILLIDQFLPLTKDCYKLVHKATTTHTPGG